MIILSKSTLYNVYFTPSYCQIKTLVLSCQYITNLKNMEKKVILITGTNSGFGWLTATSCAALGYKVYATMRNTKGINADKAKALVQQANIEVLDVDVTNGKSVMDAVTTIIKKEDRIDVVV